MQTPKNNIKTLSKLSLLMVLFVSMPQMALALCAAHDHNCFHGSTPFNPSLQDVQTGTGDLTITSKWNGEADINQHVGLPDTVDPQTGEMVHGPFVASDGDGNPNKTNPLGNDPNIVYHGQQNVQFSNATANANLTSDTQGAATLPTQVIQRQEQTTITDNVPSGRYKIALQSYNIRNTNDSANVQTKIKAGQDGYFVDEGAQQAAINNSGHIPLPDSTGTATELEVNNTVAANANSPVQEFTYRYANFNQHANGVYVIPDGVWNMHGVDPQKLYQFGTADRTDGFILNQGQQFNANPFDLKRVEIHGYGSWLYDANSGHHFALGSAQGVEGQGDARLIRVATNAKELTVLNAAVQTESDIYALHESTGRGVVKSYGRDAFNRARAIIGCANCGVETLKRAHQDILSGNNTYGLNEAQQHAFLRESAQGYSAATYYRTQKDEYNKNKAKQGIQIVAGLVSGGAGLGVLATGLVSAGTSYALYGDFKSAVISGVTASAFAGVGNTFQTSDILQTAGGVTKINYALAAKSVVAHGAIGCASSKLSDGSCSKGFRGSAFSKAVTIGSAAINANYFNVEAGKFHAGQFAVTTAAGCITGAEEGCVNAALGYAYNYLSEAMKERKTEEIASCQGGTLCEAGYEIKWAGKRVENLMAISAGSLTGAALAGYEGVSSAGEVIGTTAAAIMYPGYTYSELSSKVEHFYSDPLGNIEQGWESVKATGASLNQSVIDLGSRYNASEDSSDLFLNTLPVGKGASLVVPVSMASSAGNAMRGVARVGGGGKVRYGDGSLLIVGPRGGLARNTGSLNQAGQPIYQRKSGGFYSIDKTTGKQVPEKSPYPHGNTVGNQAAECYSLQCRRSGQVKKYGETIHGESHYGTGNQKRYSINWLEENKVNYFKEATGTKKEMKVLQTKKIQEHTKKHGKRPDLNKTDQ